MKNLMRDVDSAFRAISSIPVSGDAVDAVAVARAKLRNVYTKLEQMAAEAKEEEDVECPTQ